MKLVTLIALAVAIAIGTALSPFASRSPDGLEKVAANSAFDDAARAPQRAPVADYAFPGVDDPRLATGLAGFTGTLVVFALGAGVVAVARRNRRVA